MNITTEKLMHALQNRDPADFPLIFQQYQLDTVQPHALLSQLIADSGFKKSQIRDILGGSNYIFEVCAGTKPNPSRDFIIEVLLVIKAQLTDCQTILKYFGHAPLYAKNIRDAYLIYAIRENYTLDDINTLLLSKSLPSFIKE